MTTSTRDQDLREDLQLTAAIKLYYDLEPPPAPPAPLLLALHGYGANKRQMMREARQLAPEDFGIVSLQGPHQHLREPKEAGGPLRFGFGWLTNFRTPESVTLHHEVLLDLFKRLVDERIADPRQLFLLGFSQSCALNFRFAFTFSDRLRGVIGICGGLPGDWETSELYRPSGGAVLYLSGKRDEFYPPSRVEDYEQRLRRRAQDVECRSYDAGHEIVGAMREDVREWLVRKADQG
jgi:phospholipase/carboxylesterase